jgi:hypothetical protein
MSDETTYPYEIDERDIVRGWMIAPGERVVVEVENYPECPLDTWDHGITLHWLGPRPWWDKDGKERRDADYLEPDEIRDATPTGDAFPFVASDTRGGTDFVLADESDDPDRWAGWVVLDDDAGYTDPRAGAAGILDELTAWSQGECYYIAIQSSTDWHNDKNDDTIATWETEDWAGTFYGLDVAIESAMENYEVKA